MSGQQTSLNLDASYSTEPVVTPDLRDEIAKAWGIPLGQRVEVCLKGGERFAATGILELISTPDFPWDARKSLKLRLSGLNFTTRDIDRWTKL